MRSRQDIVLVGIAALVVAVAVIAGVVSANRTPTGPDPTTPEGVVQAYTTAVIDDDMPTMVSLLDPALGCTAPFAYGQVGAASLAVVSSTTDPTGSEATARVVVEISESRDGLLPGGTYDHRETFDLVKRDGRWLISGEPWPFYMCRGN